MARTKPQVSNETKKASKKNKASASPSEVFPCRMYPQKENNETDVQSLGTVSLSTYPLFFCNYFNF